jgi:hypothetical protein
MPKEYLIQLVVIAHIIWVLFVLIGFLWTVIAILVHRRFLDYFWVRTIHLVGVILVALLPRFGGRCPLTTLEIYLRTCSGSNYSEGFILHYVREWGSKEVGPNVIEIATFIIFLGTLAAYLYRPPKRAEKWFKWLERKTRVA